MATKDSTPNVDVQKLLIDTIVGMPPEGYSKPLTYALMRSGLFMVRRMPAAIVSRRLGEKQDIPTIADDLKEGVFLTLPKIPFEITSSILAFFKRVYELHKAEVYVSVWWNPTTEVYSVHVPKQRITGASVNHTQDHDAEGELIHVLDVHSHASMSAFFSSTDDSDEQKADRFYGVVGHLDKSVPAWKFRLRVGGAFMEINPAILLAPSTQMMQVEVNIIDALTAAKDGAAGGKVTFEVPIDPFIGTFPEEWLEKLDTFTSTSMMASWRGHQSEGPFWSHGNTKDTRGPSKATSGDRGKNSTGNVGGNNSKAPKLSKKDRRKGVLYIWQAGQCYREYPDGHREEVSEWSLDQA